MKNILLVLTMAAMLVAGNVEAQTNQLTLPTNAPSVLGPIWTALNFLSTGTNWSFIPFGIYDTGSKSGGGGIAAVLHTGDYVNPVLRLDYLDSTKTLYMPSGNVTFQYPIPIGPVNAAGERAAILPFGFVGAAVPIAGREQGNGGLLAMYGVGLALRFPWQSTAWYIPKDIVFDWEHWGMPSQPDKFPGEQYRLGFNFKIWK